MLFEGQELHDIIGHTPNEIELRNEYGRCCRNLTRAEALARIWIFSWASGTGAAFDFCAGVPGSLHSTPEATQRSA